MKSEQAVLPNPCLEEVEEDVMDNTSTARNLCLAFAFVAVTNDPL
jgi:hypothetical protein